MMLTTKARTITFQNIFVSLNFLTSLSQLMLKTTRRLLTLH